MLFQLQFPSALNIEYFFNVLSAKHCRDALLRVMLYTSAIGNILTFYVTFIRESSTDKN